MSLGFDFISKTQALIGPNPDSPGKLKPEKRTNPKHYQQIGGVRLLNVPYQLKPIRVGGDGRI
jgi:hypothetical protein